VSAIVFLVDHFDDDEVLERYGSGDTSQLFEIGRYSVPHFTASGEILHASFVDNSMYNTETDNWEHFTQLEKAI
jgi:hypothetical protein